MTKLLLIIVLLVTTISLSAQPWVKNLPANKAQHTFYDYQTAFNDYWAPYNVKGGKYIKDGVTKKAIAWKQFKRWEYDMESQIDPSTGNLPSNSAIEVYNTAKKNNQIQSLIGNTNTWSSVGPSSSAGGYSGVGRVNCITFHPTDNNTYWIGAPAGGLWKTTDNGSSWTCLTDSNDVLGVSSIIIPSDYATSNTIYIGTGDRDAFDNRSIGVLKSTDGGATWNTTGLSSTLSQGVMVYKMIIDPTNNNIIIAATNIGLLKTTNGGTTWNTQLTTQSFIDLEYKPGSFSTLYGATKYGKIYVSTNSGSTWTVKHNNGSRIELAVSPANPNYVYALIANSSGGFYGIYKSTNSGSSFTSAYNSTGLMNWYSDGSGTNKGQGSYDISLAVSPTDINKVIMGGVITHKSTDGGTSWSCSNCWTAYSGYNKGSHPVVHADKHNLVYRSNGDLFECNDGGIYLSSNNGLSWTDKSNGLVNSQMYKLGVSQTVSTETITGLQDNGTKLYSNSSWSDVKGGDGMECIIDYTDVNIQYGTYVEGQISLTTNHWASSTNIEPSGAGDGAWVTPYILDPVNHETIYAGYSNIFKSTNKGTSWTTISTMNSQQKIRSMAIAPSNNSTLYVADLTHIWKTTNGGTAWTNITGTLPAFSSHIAYIAVKNNDPNTVWVTLSGFNSNGVYKTSNGGTSWTNISTGLPSIPINSIVQDKTNFTDEVLYAGTQLGVYYKKGADNWQEYNLGFPKVRIGELEIYYDDNNSSNNKLRAATYGRGLWEVDLVPNIVIPQAPIANFSADKTSLCSGDTVTFIESSLSIPTSWSWTISPNNITYVNGTSSTSQNPIIKFANSGQYSISLIASNSIGSNTKTINNYIKVGGYEPPFIEDFETSSTTLSDWKYYNYNSGSITWALENTSGNGTSARSIYMNNYDYNSAGERDNLITPTINLENQTSAYLQFKHAYTRFSGVDSDTLLISISSDCGATFTILSSLYEDGTGNFATAPDNTYALGSKFYPATASDWCGSGVGADCDSIDISAYAGSSNVVIKFQSITAYSNNLYLDDIQIIGTNTPNIVASFTNPNSSICAGVSTTYTNTSQNATSYQWKIDNISVSTSQHLTHTFATGGTKDVKLIVSDGTSFDSISQFVTITDTPGQAGIPSGPIDLCFNPANSNYTTTVIAGATSYNWTITPSNAGTITNTNENAIVNWNNSFAGTATITVAGVSSCGTGTISPSLSVTINDVPGNPSTPNGLTQLCEGNVNTNYSINIVPNANSYSWVLSPSSAGSIVGTGNSIDINWANNYNGTAKLKANATNNCGNGPFSSELTINISSLPPTPTITKDVGVFTSSSSSNNQWYKSSNPINGATQQTYTPTVNGSYAVEVSNSGGCKSKSTYMSINNVGINKLLVGNKVKVFPNPAKDYVIIEYSGNENVILNFNNTIGELIISKEFNKTIKLDLSEISSGVYFIVIHLKNNSDIKVIKKIVISKN